MTDSSVRDDIALILSCEHGGCDVPAAFEHLFASEAAARALDSHRGWDPGAAELAEALSVGLHAPLQIQTTTRLLVECNRSRTNSQLWSEFSRHLPAAEKASLLDLYWTPHRDGVERLVAARPGLVVHVGVHTFTPTWKGRRRATDIGILYDPSRPAEARIAAAWRDHLRTSLAAAGRQVHRNRPYRGWTDGLVRELRGRWSEERYAGLELEVSQALVPVDPPLIDALATGLRSAIDAVGA